jgi:hypothetical protein
MFLKVLDAVGAELRLTRRSSSPPYASGKKWSSVAEGQRTTHMHLESEKSKTILMVVPSPPHQGIIPSFLGQMAAMGLGMFIMVPAAIDTYLVSRHQYSYSRVEP